jgi:hypothetical protein
MGFYYEVSERNLPAADYNGRSQMTDIQIAIIALPSVLSIVAVLVGILINNSRLGDTNSRISELRSHMDNRFDDMRDTWRAELRRVEEVIDARLKHLEES